MVDNFQNSYVQNQNVVGNVAKYGGTAFGIFYLVKMIGFAIFMTLIMLVLIAMGVPWYFAIIFIIFVWVMVIFQIIRIKRISSARL